MKRSTLVATCVACVLGSSWSAARAQGQAPPAGPNLAVIDLNYIFKEHARFKALREDMKREVERAEEEIKRKRSEVQRLAENLENFKPGSAEFKDLETRLTKMQADLSAEVQIKKKDFMIQEAKIYYTAYQEVLDEVRYYSDQNGIGMVLRISNEPVDPNDPQAVLDELKKTVVHHHKAIDISQVVLAAINRRAGAAPTAGGAPAGAPAARSANARPQPGPPRGAPRR